MSLEQDIKALTDAIRELTAAIQGGKSLPSAASTASIEVPKKSLAELRQLCKESAQEDLQFASKLSLFLKEEFNVSNIAALSADGVDEVYHHIQAGNISTQDDPAQSGQESSPPAPPAPPPIKVMPPLGRPVHSLDRVSERCIELIRSEAVTKKQLLEVLNKYNGAKTIKQVPEDCLPELADILDKIGKGEYTHD